MGIEQDPECRWDVLRIIFGDGFRDMFLNFTKNIFFDSKTSFLFESILTTGCKFLWYRLYRIV